MTNEEIANAGTNIDRLCRLFGYGDASPYVKFFGAAAIVEHIPELKQSPDTLSENDLKAMGNRLSEVFLKLAQTLK